MLPSGSTSYGHPPRSNTDWRSCAIRPVVDLNLFYYILKEAELRETTDYVFATGARIVAEVFIDCSS